MIEVFDCEQGSDEWRALRLGIPTTSEFKSIMAQGSERRMRRSYMMRLAAERITGEPQDAYQNAHMRRGKTWEGSVRNGYELVEDVVVKPIGFVRNGMVGCSPDGFVDDDGMAEFKTRLPALMMEPLATGVPPTEYRAQVQGALWVCERQWCDLVCYWPALPVFIKRIERDEDYIAKLATEVEVFLGELEDIVRGITERT